MGYNKSNIVQLLRSYKGLWLAAGVSLLTLFLLGVGTIGFLGYQASAFVNSKVTTFRESTFETLSKDGVAQAGLIEDFLMNAASRWVQQNLATSETQRFGAGLACFGALGGPNQKQIIDHVKTRVDDARLLARLDDLGARLEKANPQTNGLDSCTSWFLSG